MTTLNTHVNYTIWEAPYQLSLPLNISFQIPDDDPVRLVKLLIERMDLSPLYQTYSRIEKNQASPRQLLAIVIYASMNQIFSSRRIESACRRDLNFQYLLEGKPVPDHATIARFRSHHMAACSRTLFADMDAVLAQAGALSLKNLFIDGTKIESVANKYTFVWKKSVTKRQAKVLAKIPGFILKTQELFGIQVLHTHAVHRYHLRRLLGKLKRLQREGHIVFVHGKGHRKTPLQKAIEKAKDFLHKTKEYAVQLHYCGDRNSYAKTDIDATFMHLKEDAMKNGQVKPAYNVQYSVDAGFVTWVTVGPQTSDCTTLLPFLEDFRKHFPFQYTRIIADSGYESEENYTKLAEQGYDAYIKPSDHEQRKKRRFKKDIGKFQNMDYDAKNDVFYCHNHRKLTCVGKKTETTSTGFKIRKSHYVCEDCSDCPYKKGCIHGNRSKKPLEKRTKQLELSKRFQAQRAEMEAHISSPTGKMLRMNRSIQSEGAFSDIKANLSFRRFLSHGTENALATSIILAMAHNVLILHHKLQSGNFGTYLYSLKKVKKSA